MTTSTVYEIDVPGLAVAVANCLPDETHKALVQCLRSFGQLSSVKLVTSRGGDGSHYLARRKVLTRDGVLVSDDHKEWVAEQLQLDGGDAGKTQKRLRDQGFLLSKCELTSLYLVQDKRTENQAEFIQVAIRQEEEFIDARAFDKYSWSVPKTLQDLFHELEGETLPAAERRRIRPPAYQLDAVVDVDAFVAEAEEIDAGQRAKMRGFIYTVSDASPDLASDARSATHDELFPGWDSQPHKSRRFFNDWEMSSAGRSGARLCDHWVVQLSDWTDPKSGTRYLSLVPMWSFAQKLAEVEPNKGDTYAHFGKLQTLDRRVKVPFGWYFYMLHGNRVHDGSAKRVLADAESGLIVLSEHDYRVLKAWRQHPYGF